MNIWFFNYWRLPTSKVPTLNQWSESHLFSPSLSLSASNHNGRGTTAATRARPPRRSRRRRRRRRRSHSGRRRRRRGARLLEALRHYNPRLRVHSAPSVVHPRLPLLSPRFQPSRFGLARHYQSTLSLSLCFICFTSHFFYSTARGSNLIVLCLATEKIIIIIIIKIIIKHVSFFFFLLFCLIYRWSTLWGVFLVWRCEFWEGRAWRNMNVIGRIWAFQFRYVLVFSSFFFFLSVWNYGICTKCLISAWWLVRACLVKSLF